jgi:acid phosphatase (class B)
VTFDVDDTTLFTSAGFQWGTRTYGKEIVSAGVSDLPNLDPVIFTNRGSKTPAFKRVQAVVSYGDSDGDIRESFEPGARPVRVLRARTSVNVEPVHNGAFGEEVLLNSEF